MVLTINPKAGRNLIPFAISVKMLIYDSGEIIGEGGIITLLFMLIITYGSLSGVTNIIAEIISFLKKPKSKTEEFVEGE